MSQMHYRVQNVMSFFTRHQHHGQTQEQVGAVVMEIIIKNKEERPLTALHITTLVKPLAMNQIMLMFIPVPRDTDLHQLADRDIMVTGRKKQGFIHLHLILYATAVHMVLIALHMDNCIAHFVQADIQQQVVVLQTVQRQNVPVMNIQKHGKPRHGPMGQIQQLIIYARPPSVKQAHT